MDWACGDVGATDAALAEADVVVRQRLVNQRLIPTPMEARGAAADYDPGTGQYTVWMSSQCPHVMRLLMTAFVFGISETKMRCISPQVGGAFGTKIFLYPEYVLDGGARREGRPAGEVDRVAARELRRDDARPRPHHLPRGRREARRHDHGAEGEDATPTSAAFSRPSPPASRRRSTGGCCRAPTGSRAIHCQVLGVYTNTGMVDAYRGAGRPEATYVVERAMDLVARELGLDPVEVRRKNFIPPDAFPYDPGILAGLTYDSGDYEKALDRALEIVDYDGFRARAGGRRAREGRYLGIGFSTYVEICGVAPSAWIGDDRPGLGRRPVGERERARPPHRQGGRHDRLASRTARGTRRRWRRSSPTSSASPIDDVTVEHGDTPATPFGYGTYGSRSAAVGTVAVYNALQRDQGEGDAGSRRTCSRPTPSDMVYEDGRAFVVGSPDTGKTIQEIAAAAAVAYDLPEGEEPFLDDTAYYDPPNCTFPFGTHMAVVEVDAETGEVALTALRRGRRRRAGDQPADRRRPGARRHRPGRRPGALGGRGLRRERPAPDARA